MTAQIRQAYDGEYGYQGRSALRHAHRRLSAVVEDEVVHDLVTTAKAVVTAQSYDQPKKQW